MEARFVPFVLDRFGSLGEEAAALVETIAAESDNPGLTPSLTNLSFALPHPTFNKVANRKRRYLQAVAEALTPSPPLLTSTFCRLHF